MTANHTPAAPPNACTGPAFGTMKVAWLITCRQCVQRPWMRLVPTRWHRPGWHGVRIARVDYDDRQKDAANGTDLAAMSALAQEVERLTGPAVRAHLGQRRYRFHCPEPRELEALAIRAPIAPWPYTPAPATTTTGPDED